MRASFIFLVVIAATSNASWFASDKPAEYSNWDSTQLKAWLIENNLYSPTLKNAPPSTLKAIVQANYDSASSWTQDQYNTAQKTFENVRADAFDTWEETRLREFLKQSGVDSPNAAKDELVALAQSKYAAYTNAASSLSAHASATASSVVFSGAHEASKSIASMAAQATHQTSKALNDSQDYIYSTWDDNKLRSYLVEKGVVKSKSQNTRDEMLAMMKNSYASVADPIYSAWSDSYMREWLVEHGIVSPNTSPSTMKRTDLEKLLKNYYYGTNDYVWSTWSESDTKAWLVKNGYVKSDAQISREKAQKMVSDTYSHATSTILSTYSDSSLRNWLIEKGYLRSDAQVKRDQLVAMVSERYNDAVAKGDEFFTQTKHTVLGNYLTWPDARLRAYLRQHGLSEDKIPGDRPGLLQETRIRWVQAGNVTESAFDRVKDIINFGVGAVEERIGQILSILTGVKHEASAETEKKYAEMKGRTEKEINSAKKEAEKAYQNTKIEGEKMMREGKVRGEQAKASGEKLMGEL